MKNKDFDSFNNDRIASLRARINDLIYLLNTWESKKPRLVDKSTTTQLLNSLSKKK